VGKTTIRLTGALVLLACTGASAGAALQGPDSGPSLELTLANAQRIALQQNLDLLLERGATEVARLGFLGSWGAFDPLASISAGLTRTEVQSSTSLIGASVLEQDTQDLVAGITFPLRTGGRLDIGYSRSNLRTNSFFSSFPTSTTDVVSVSLTQPLLRGAWWRFATSNQREAEIAYRQQVERQEEARQRILADVSRAYWAVLATQDLLQIQKLTTALAEEQLDQIKKSRDVGLASDIDVVQFETNLALQVHQDVLARDAFLTAQDVLRLILFQRGGPDGSGRLESWDWPIIPISPFPAGPTTEQEPTRFSPWPRSFQIAIDSRPELHRQRLEIEAAEVRLERARSNRKAGLDLVVSAAGTGFDPTPFDALETALGFEYPSLSASVVYTRSIGNRLAKRGAEAALVSLRASHLVYERIELAVLADVRSASRRARTAAAATLAAKAALVLSERQLEAEQIRNREGLSTTFQVLAFQKDLSRARSAERNARADWAVAQTDLLRAKGQLGRTPVTE